MTSRAANPRTVAAKRVFDARADTLDFRDAIFEPTLVEVPPRIPLDHYLASDPSILDQGTEGACTGFALAFLGSRSAQDTGAATVIRPTTNTVSGSARAPTALHNQQSMAMRRTALAILTICLWLALAACGAGEGDVDDNQSSTGLAAVAGAIVLGSEASLPDDAQVRVVLADVSRMDVAAQVIAEQTIYGPLRPPIAFRIEYHPDHIDQRMSYAVQARIESRGRLLFVTTEHHPVITRGNPVDIEVRVDPVAR